MDNLFRALLMVILMVRRRDKEAKRFMGHDLNQFKSLEVCVQIYRLFFSSMATKPINIRWIRTC